MKFLWVAFLLPLPGLTAAAQSPTQMPAVDGTIALYQFNEGTGMSAADDVGSYSAALYWSSPPLWIVVEGRSGLDCTPAISRVHPNWTIPVGSDWTIQAVVHLPVTPNAAGYNVLAGLGQTNCHVVLKDNELGVLRTGADNFFGSGHDIGGLTGWHLISAVGSGSQTAFYVDADPVGSPAANQVTGDVWAIGGINSDRPWGGPIDGLRILDVARTVGEIAGDANTLFPPAALAGTPGQFRLSDAPIAPGGRTTSGFIVKATVTGASPLHLEVEVKPAGDPFDEIGLLSGSGVSHASVASVSTGTLAPGTYHWRVRALNNYGTTPWHSFGADPPGDVDVEVVANSAPTAGPAIQVRGSDGSLLASGQTVFDRDDVRFEAVGSDVDGDAVRLEVEVRPAGTAFMGQATAIGLPVPAGQTASCTVSFPPGGYSWQARIVDSDGVGTAWTPFGATPGNADFVIRRGGSSGTACAASPAAGPAAFLLAALIALFPLQQRRPTP